MCSASEAHELAVLLRISREFDIAGDLTATVDNPSELVAWTMLLDRAEALAWRADESGRRYLQVTAHSDQSPIKGRITAVLPCKDHLDFWNALGLSDLPPGEHRELPAAAISDAWMDLPLKTLSEIPDLIIESDDAESA